MKPVPPRLQASVLGVVSALTDSALIPESPVQLQQKDVDAALRRVTQAKVRPRADSPKGHLWRAIILDRWQYTCVYCERDAWRVHEAEKRTLRLELDHLVPRAKAGDDYDLSNIVVACRTCNEAKGQLPPDLFMYELRSLAAAVLRTNER